MLKKVVLLFLIAFTLNACVSKKVYTELETKYNNLRSANSELIQEKDNLLVAKKALEDDLLNLNKDFNDLTTQKAVLENELNALQNKYNNLDESYLALSAQSSKKLAEQAQNNL